KTGGSGLRHQPVKAEVQRSVFIIERNEYAQEKLREKFKERGFRVFMASDPVRALERYRSQPFDALIINAGTTGEDGLFVFAEILQTATAKDLACAAILILSAEQTAWKSRVVARPGSAVLVPPVTIKTLCEKLDELLTA